MREAANLITVITSSFGAYGIYCTIEDFVAWRRRKNGEEL